jgi:surface polysaccharide O-acyltransferase-like enzyme
MKHNQVLKINNNYFYLNNENQNLKSSNQITVNEYKENNYIEYFDYIRIISSLGVIIIHVCSQNMNRSFPGPNWEVFNFYTSIVRWSVPEFFMISGVLFLNKSSSIKKLFKKNIMKIGISYIFWSLVYCIKEKFIKDIKLNDLILNFIVGHYHLWFLFSIIELYMMVPFLLLIIKYKVILNYFLILSFISTFIFHNIILYSKYFIKKNIIEIIEKIYSKLNNKYISGNIFYFMFGYYLNKVNTKNIKLEIIIYFFGLIGMIFEAKISSYLSNKKKIRIKDFYSSISIHVLFQSISIFIFFKNYFNKLRINKKYKKIIKNLGKYTFGIYLIHALVLEEFERIFNYNSLSFKPIFNVIFLSFSVFFVSLIIIILLNKTIIKYFI